MVRGLRDVLLDVIITINAMIFQRVSRYDNSVCTLLLQASVSIFDETAYFFFYQWRQCPMKVVSRENGFGQVQ